ncbi:MAG TPA: autotransporter-associated beta strand repeat-containing protein, partial [Chitinophagales bacterium]|nr:autotransporter-associated beta strand repeat-containing protein [Chitinophagales bacterium]
MKTIRLTSFLKNNASKLVILYILMAISSFDAIAVTKTWSSGTVWGTAVWSPAGTPVAGDDLIFNAAVAMTAVPTISLNLITVNNAVAVTMTAAASGNTITLGAGGLNVTNAGGTFNIGASGTILKLTPGMTITATGTIAVASGGVLDLNGGTYNLGNSFRIAGTGITSGGALINSSATAATLTNNITMTAASSIGGTGDITLSGVISGAFALTKVGTNTLTLSGNNTYSGATTISSGTLKLGAAGTATNTPLGTSAGGVTVSSGATLDLNGFTLGTSEALTLNGTGVGGAGALTNTGVASATWAGTVALASATTIGGSANIVLSQNVTGAFALTKEGENTLLLNSSTTTSAFTTLNINNGTVQLGTTAAVNGQILNTCAVVISGDGSLNLGSQSEQIGSLASASTTATVTATSGTPVLTVGDATSTTFAGVIQNGGGTVGLTKIGAGTLTLSGTNTYTGNTTVNAGTLALGANNVIADNSNVVLGGGTLSSGGFSDTMGTLSTTTSTSSTIALSGTSTLTFAAGGSIAGNLAITGYGTSAGHVFIGNSQTLSVSELSKITVNGSPACQSTTGEIIPKGAVSTTTSVIFTNISTSVTFQQTGGTAGGTWSITPTTMGTINSTTGAFTAGTTTGLVVVTYTSPEGCESTMDFYISGTGNLWVNPATGVDTNTGTPASPLQSIRQALRNLTATNSTIHIMPGNYSYANMTSNANRDLGFGPGQSVTTGINNAFLPGTVIQGEGCVYWNNSNTNGTGAQNSVMTIEAVDGFTIRNIRFNGWQGTLASVHFINCTNVLVEDCIFHQDALAASGHALRFEGDATETAISGTPSLIYNIRNCIFQNNGNPSGQSTGEALYVRNNGTGHLPTSREFRVNIDNSSFVCNFASTGGALYSEAVNSADEHPNIQINGCNFSGNKTSSQGGAIFHKYTDLTVNNTTFCNNDAGSALSDRDGGAIHCDQGSTLTVNGCTFQDNVAGRYGSAISIASNATSSSVSNSVFYSNNAGNSTSNVYRSAIANATLTNCLFKDNALTGGFSGGPIATGGTITNSTFSGNAGIAVTGTGVIDDHAIGTNWVDATGHAFQANGTQVGYTGAFYSLPDCTPCPAVPGTGCDASAGAGLFTNSTCFYVCSDTTATTDISKS